MKWYRKNNIILTWTRMMFAIIALRLQLLPLIGIKFAIIFCGIRNEVNYKDYQIKLKLRVREQIMLTSIKCVSLFCVSE